MDNIKGGKLFHLFLSCSAAFLTISLILFPDRAFDAAVDGLNIWWEVVFPALLPFFIGAEILMGLGVVHFMGVMLEPLMRPIFNVPGAGSFVMAVGLASGFPIGSILTSKLRRDSMLTKTEAERLLCFTNTADPLFMFGAVAVGMFHNAQLGLMIAAAHYMSSFTVGLLMRFYKKNSSDITKEPKSQEHIVIRAFKAMFDAKDRDGRTMGKLLGDAIKNSVNNLLLIGGFIILFSVIIRILTVVGVVDLITAILAPIFVSVGLEPDLIPAIISGFFEISLGSEIAGNLPAEIPLVQKLMAVGAIIAWSGLSVHAQVASITSDTDINIIPFICARVVHGLLAAIYTIPVVNYIFADISLSHTVTAISKTGTELIYTWGLGVTWSLSVFIILILFTILLMLLYTLGISKKVLVLFKNRK
ncbi:sporulation integral membrane protein YlbJ [Natranaerobius thermophilus]|uniref:Sporulation integral membrane protein YlbJ n=1 Tax=Natranaerobius thermophilus (strain ATCC BAA-1301 / DSM 18059 / JW/NM-WN-LF) TaxID=457570 RepID=B2A2L8_NATTJ|nr:sporulation integral membrane protein YlbJ [Natranaerobius thermophilus]ACB84933.1 sporulation integral membrane protein YlbJ [Natranaerobius thermophilus JW/NM-WN-LF]